MYRLKGSRDGRRRVRRAGELGVWGAALVPDIDRIKQLGRVIVILRNDIVSKLMSEVNKTRIESLEPRIHDHVRRRRV